MPARYDSRSVQVTLNAVDNFVFIMPGNRNRVGLNISGDGSRAANLALLLTTSANLVTRFLIMDPGGNEQLPFRDWGPLIKEQIYARVDLGSMDASFVEIFVIPSVVGG